MSDRVVRAMLALIVLALSVFYVVTKAPRLGLDLRGGTQIVLETRDSVTVKADRESTGQTLEVLRRRVDALGVSEPAIAQSGERRIIVELPGVQEPRRRPSWAGRRSSPSTRFSAPLDRHCPPREVRQTPEGSWCWQTKGASRCVLARLA